MHEDDEQDNDSQGSQNLGVDDLEDDIFGDDSGDVADQDDAGDDDDDNDPDDLVAKSKAADDDTGDDDQDKSDKQDETAASSQDDNSDGDTDTVPLKTYLDLKSELKEAKTEVERLKAKPDDDSDDDSEDEPDPVSDPEGFAKKQEQKLDAKLIKDNIRRSRAMLKATPGYEDFDDIEQEFLKAIQTNPLLATQMAQNDHPALFAYEQGKKSKALADIGDDPEAYKQKIRKEVEQELAAQGEKPKPKKSDNDSDDEDTPNLADTTGSGMSEELEQINPDSLEDLFPEESSI